MEHLEMVINSFSESKKNFGRLIKFLRNGKEQQSC